MSDKLTKEEFVIRAIERLREPGYQGIHSVYSGFNDAFRQYYSEEDANPVVITTALAKDGKIMVRFAKGGVMLYKPGEAPRNDVAKDTLKKMGL